MTKNNEMQLCVACNKLVSIGETSCKCGHVLREALTLKEEQTSRKRRAVYRPNSVSSEWISMKEKSELKMALKKSKLENGHQNITHIGHGNTTTNNASVTPLQNNTTNNKSNPLNDANNNSCTVAVTSAPTFPRPVGRPRKNGSTFNNRKKSTKQTSANAVFNSTAPISNSSQITKNNENALTNNTKENTDKQNKLRGLLEMIENSYQNIYFNKCKSYKKAKLADLEFEFDFSAFDSHNPYYPSALEDINTKINKTNSFWKSLHW